MQGTCLFYAGWLCGGCRLQVLQQVLIKDWCCVTGGYILGSVCLLSASYHMVLDLAEPTEMPVRQASDEEAPFLQS